METLTVSSGKCKLLEIYDFEFPSHEFQAGLLQNISLPEKVVELPKVRVGNFELVCMLVSDI